VLLSTQIADPPPNPAQQRRSPHVVHGQVVQKGATV